MNRDGACDQEAEAFRRAGIDEATGFLTSQRTEPELAEAEKMVGVRLDDLAIQADQLRRIEDVVWSALGAGCGSLAFWKPIPQLQICEQARAQEGWVVQIEVPGQDEGALGLTLELLPNPLCESLRCPSQ